MPSVHSARVFQMACAALVALALSSIPAGATSRIKDLANIEGVRQNQLIGYGLEVGLNGTGDTLNNIPFTKQSLQAMLERLGVNIRGAAIRRAGRAADRQRPLRQRVDVAVVAEQRYQHGAVGTLRPRLIA